jgi:signal transduction histidine kinase
MSSDAIALGHLEGVYPLLDLLQVGFVLLDPAGEVVHASALARRMLGRRVDGAQVRNVLGAVHDDLVTSVLSGKVWTTRWRDHSFQSPDGDTLELAIRSVRVDQSALLAFYDVSVEVALHRRYKELLGRQEAITEELRRRIAVVLREHEDDHAQFHELLQIAPAIFASFVGEAQAALRAVTGVAEAEHLDAATVLAALRESHTLKGNARGLGLHFIAGRAHAVEEQLASARKTGQLPDRTELAAGAADLGRAIERAVSLRGGLGGAAGPSDSARADLAEIAGALTAARAATGDAALRDRLDHALATVERMTHVPLAQLLHYLRTTAQTAAEAAGLDEPHIEAAVGDVAVPPAVHAVLQTALPHLVRNAVVHGLEPAAERTRSGKSSSGLIAIAAHFEGDMLHVSVRDDGRGIDRAALAAALGPAGDDLSLEALIFHPGLSTRAEVDLDSGRGMGAAAAREAIVAAGGTLAVTTAVGAGTTFEVRIPGR